MANYVTRGEVLKGAWTVLVVVISVAAWSIGVLMSYSEKISTLENLMTQTTTKMNERHIGNQSVKDELNSISDRVTQVELNNAQRDGMQKYTINMLELLLNKSGVKLPEAPIVPPVEEIPLETLILRKYPNGVIIK